MQSRKPRHAFWLEKGPRRVSTATLYHASESRCVFDHCRGLEMDVFVWDPIGVIQGQQQLFIRASHNANIWFIDARIKAIQTAPSVNTVSGEIGPAHSMELEC